MLAFLLYFLCLSKQLLIATLSVFIAQKIQNRDYVSQNCSGITCGRVLSGELYAQRLQKLTLKVLVAIIDALGHFETG